MKTINEIWKENCELMIPTKWNIYEWAEEHPETTIAHSIKRIEKIFDFSDALQLGFSGGKDSTVSAHLACLELNLRRLRLKYGVDRNGNPGIDPLDAKWANRRLHLAMTDAEVVFSDTNDYAKRFIKEHGPEGLDLIEFNWICLPLAWQSGVSFDSGILISWDKSKKNIWVQDMPTKEELHGFQCLHEDNLDKANSVRLDSLSEDAQKYHIEHGHVFEVSETELFNAKEDSNLNVMVKAVANYGRGPVLKNFKPGCHEKEEQDDYSLWFAETTWLISNPDKEAIREALEKRYDLKNDVWFLKPYGEGKTRRTSVALISLRAEESLDRRVILSQGEYSTGQYSRNQGVNICSPVFDYTTSDIWRLLSATDWDVNDVYQKLFEVGVAPSDQRVGSLLNYAAVRQISTVKALEPDLYGKINGRFQNVEFMSQFSRAGYFKIGKPKNVSWDGHNHIKAGYELEEIDALSNEYERWLTVFNIPYERKGNEFNTADPKLKGKPWYPFRNLNFDEIEGLTEEDAKSLKKLSIIHTSWRDYTLMLLNSTADPLRSIWREKVLTSIAHWHFNTGSISEGNIAGAEILSELPKELTEELVNDSFHPDGWYKGERLAGSKRMKVFLGHYPQESIANEANICLKYIVNNWDEYGHLIFESPLLKRIWDLAQASGGKCIIPDEVLTYLLEKPINDNQYGAWIDVAYDVFEHGIPSEKYKEYWKAEKIKDFPLALEDKIDENGNYIYLSTKTWEPIDLEEQKKNFLSVCDIFLKEDVSMSPCWKKIAICILKNDVSFKYAGFAPTLRERQAREEATAAFATKQEEREKAKIEAQRLAEKIEKERRAKEGF